MPIHPMFVSLSRLWRHLELDGISLSQIYEEATSTDILEFLSDSDSLNLFLGWLNHFGAMARRIGRSTTQMIRWGATADKASV